MKKRYYWPQNFQKKIVFITIEVSKIEEVDNLKKSLVYSVNKIQDYIIQILSKN
ncbi:MAG: hypothetical protein CM15mP81_00010 [Alphaproteobacteria bacterium]|nr:MAG: hypothetical protein CM15mP81_00010 [Alphaproteobacteria bacterium]